VVGSSGREALVAEKQHHVRNAGTAGSRRQTGRSERFLLGPMHGPVPRANLALGGGAEFARRVVRLSNTSPDRGPQTRTLSQGVTQK
jgi:hypothetical protein